MNRLLIFFITIALFFGVTSFSGGYVGVSSQCVGDSCFVMASTSYLSIILGLIFVVFALKFPRASSEDAENRAGFWRRFGAFLIDFMLVMSVLTPIVVLPAIFTEFIHTDTFMWSFQRDYARPSDNIIILPSVFIIFLGHIYYLYKYTLLTKPTLGQYILGYRVKCVDGTMTASIARKRVSLSILGVCLWPISVIHGLIKKRVFWWDSGSGSIAVLTSTANKSSQQDAQKARASA
jgi:uncharacterized RDD family membrane protein YckC